VVEHNVGSACEKQSKSQYKKHIVLLLSHQWKGDSGEQCISERNKTGKYMTGLARNKVSLPKRLNIALGLHRTSESIA
jgi:hypothetical protein